MSATERRAWLWTAPPRRPERRIAQLLLRWRLDPVLFAFEAIRTALTPYQAGILLDLFCAPREVYDRYGLEPMGTQGRVLVPSGHGLGKTRLIAVALWAHTLTRRASKRLVTAPTSDQLTKQLWGEVRKLYRRLNRFWPELAADWEVQTAAVVHKDPTWGDWITLARTARADQPEALQGAHALDEDDAFGDLARAWGDAETSAPAGGILVVFEEASGVPDTIRETLEGSLSEQGALLLAAGNPTRADGWFARDCERSDRFAVHPLDCRMSDKREVYSLPFVDMAGDVHDVRVRGFVSPSYWESILAEADGDEDADRVRVRVRGLPPRSNIDQVLLAAWVEAARARDPHPEDDDADIVIGMDFGHVGDKHGVVTRQGHCWRDVQEWLPSAAPQEALNSAYYRGLDAIEQWWRQGLLVTVIGDSNGVGAGVMARYSEMLRERGRTLGSGYPRVLLAARSGALRVIHFNSGEGASDAGRFYRRRDEMWYREGRRFFSSPRCSIPDFPGLMAQLTSPGFEEDATKRIKVQTKQQILRETGERSGNAADAGLSTLMIRDGVRNQEAKPAATGHALHPSMAAHFKRLKTRDRQGEFIR